MTTGLPSYCARCVRSLPRKRLPPPPRTARAFSTTPSPSKPSEPAQTPGSSTSPPKRTPRSQSTQAQAALSERAPENDDPPPRGALSRRLEQATEDALLSRSGRRAVEEAGFSEELKARLQARISAADPQDPHHHHHAPPSSGPEIPRSAGPGTRLHALSQPWTGTEETEDVVLRMLDDSTRKLPPDLRGPSAAAAAAGARRVGGARRLEDARERAESYRETGLSERERKEVRAELRERFGTGVRNMPALSLTGLASLANERIEDAIARGQFKDIPRGPSLKRDTTADNPFVDTTEYLMNNMLKKQKLVPPWIEKQQEIARAASNLRSALRDSWARHVASVITSRGGSRDEQLRTAEAYARAEGAQPRRRADQGSVSASRTDDAVFKDALPPARDASPSSSESGGGAGHAAAGGRPFRDPAWEERQAMFVALSVEKLNAMTRSYNLMAPDLAKKAYFSAEKEMEGCFRDAAPLIAGEIRGRTGDKAEGLSLFGLGGADGRAYERAGGQYGLKEMWRDIWGRKAR